MTLLLYAIFIYVCMCIFVFPTVGTHTHTNIICIYKNGYQFHTVVVYKIRVVFFKGNTIKNLTLGKFTETCLHLAHHSATLHPPLSPWLSPEA